MNCPLSSQDQAAIKAAMESIQRTGKPPTASPLTSHGVQVLIHTPPRS
jgi:hypothetical protein